MKKRVAAAEKDEQFSSMNRFVESILWQWHRGCSTEARAKASLCLPEDVDWHKVCEDVFSEKFGEYTMNPKTAFVDWEKQLSGKLEVKSFNEMVGSPISEVVEQAIIIYGHDRYLPGIECQRFFTKNHDHAFDVLANGRRFFFFGSTVRNRAGHLLSPYFVWSGGILRLDGLGFCFNWQEDDRVILLKK